MVQPKLHKNTLESLGITNGEANGTIDTIVVYNNYKIDKMPNVIGEKIVGGGTSIYNENRYISMSVFDVGDKVIRQSLDYYSSMSYKIKKCIFKACLNTLKDTSGYRSRIGIFDDSNDKIEFDGISSGGSGLFFQLENNIISIGIRYGIEDNGDDIIINQNEWNINKLEKESYFDFRRWDKIQDFEISYNTNDFIEWAIIINGSRILLHRYIKVNHDYNIIHRFDLPIRYEIEKIGPVDNFAELRQFEESISIKDHLDLSNINNGGGGGGGGNTTNRLIFKSLSKFSNKPYTIKSYNDYIPIFSVRLKLIYNRNPIVNYILDGLCITEFSFLQIAIIKNPTFTDKQPSWEDTDYTLQYDNTSNLIDQNNLNIINEIYVIPRNKFPHDNLENSAVSLSSNISGTPDVFTIVARRLDAGSSAATCYINFKWLEDS